MAVTSIANSGLTIGVPGFLCDELVRLIREDKKIVGGEPRVPGLANWIDKNRIERTIDVNPLDATAAAQCYVSPETRSPENRVGGTGEDDVLVVGFEYLAHRRKMKTGEPGIDAVVDRLICLLSLPENLLLNAGLGSDGQPKPRLIEHRERFETVITGRDAGRDGTHMIAQVAIVYRLVTGAWSILSNYLQNLVPISTLLDMEGDVITDMEGDVITDLTHLKRRS